jgi:hypothetical protein
MHRIFIAMVSKRWCVEEEEKEEGREEVVSLVSMKAKKCKIWIGGTCIGFVLDQFERGHA